MKKILVQGIIECNKVSCSSTTTAFFEITASHGNGGDIDIEFELASPLSSGWHETIGWKNRFLCPLHKTIEHHY